MTFKDVKDNTQKYIKTVTKENEKDSTEDSQEVANYKKQILDEFKQSIKEAKNEFEIAISVNRHAYKQDIAIMYHQIKRMHPDMPLVKNIDHFAEQSVETSFGLFNYLHNITFGEIYRSEIENNDWSVILLRSAVLIYDAINAIGIDVSHPKDLNGELRWDIALELPINDFEQNFFFPIQTLFESTFEAKKQFIENTSEESATVAAYSIMRPILVLLEENYKYKKGRKPIEEDHFFFNQAPHIKERIKKTFGKSFDDIAKEEFIIYRKINKYFRDINL